MGSLLLQGGGSLLLQGGGDLLLQGEPAVTPTYLYTPPTFSQKREIQRNFSFTEQVGETVIVNSGTYTAVRIPTAGELNAADTFYLGGHEYPVSEATKTAIEASGVGGTFTAL